MANSNICYRGGIWRGKGRWGDGRWSMAMVGLMAAFPAMVYGPLTMDQQAVRPVLDMG